MNNKQLREILIAMMHASRLDPLMDDDCYQNICGSTIGDFLEGVVSYFNLRRDSWIVHFPNFDYLDSPSETITFLIAHKDSLLENFK